jgi:hypothetical protein
MSKPHSNYSSGTRTGFIDLLCQILLGFTALLVIALLLINPIVEPEKKIDPKSDYLVILTWPNYVASDIDLWVKDPEGNIASFKRKEVGLMNLDRDDLGLSNDTIVTASGETIINPKNQEILSIRGQIPGEWTVNVHFFRRKVRVNPRVPGENRDTKIIHTGPIPITIELIQLNPFKTLITEELDLLTQKEERTAFNFTIVEYKGKYEVRDINKIKRKLIYKVLDGEEGGQ